MSINENILLLLKEKTDPAYKCFSEKIIRNIDPERILGVRTPEIKMIYHLIRNDNESEIFLSSLPHSYQEEDYLHAMFIKNERDYERAISLTNAFLPYVDNWATCDGMSPKSFRKNTGPLMTNIKLWITSDRTYTVRFAIKCLMDFYLDDAFTPDILKLTASVASDEYYVNMMQAWFFATALAKQKEETIVYITENRLPVWVHNKSIQKAVESYRIDDDTKAFLKTLKIKNGN